MDTELPPRDPETQRHFDQMPDWQQSFVDAFERSVERRLVTADFPYIKWDPELKQAWAMGPLEAEQIRVFGRSGRPASETREGDRQD